MGRSIDISPDEKYIAVGMINGDIDIIDAEKWQLITVLKKRNKWISTTKFSPSGDMLAVGSHDHNIDIYMVPSFKKKFTMKKHPSCITHLDWSEKSDFLQSNCGGEELLYWDMSTGTNMQNGRTTLRDEKWSTFSCVLGWPVQGIW